VKSLELYLSRAEHLAVLGLNPSQAGKIAAISAEADAFKNMAAMDLQQNSSRLAGRCRPRTNVQRRKPLQVKV
jgi:hypothetical protein